MSDQSSDGARSGDALSNLMHEDRRFPPPEDLAAKPMSPPATYAEADADFEGFWAEQAERLSWDTEPTEMLDWSNPPFAKWYADGTLNAAYNCLRPPRRGRQRRPGGLLLRGRTRRHPGDHLRRADHRGEAGRQRADRARA